MLLYKQESSLFEALWLSYWEIKWLGNIWYGSTYEGFARRGMWVGGGNVVGRLTVGNEILQAVLRRTKAIVTARKRNKAARSARVNCSRLEYYIIPLSKRRLVNLQQILRFLKHLEENIFNSAIILWFLDCFSKILTEINKYVFFNS
jgi:hypothetical protein